MPMPSYPVICYSPDCGELATLKIASRWSDGVTGELKTYFLSCDQCASKLMQKAREKRDACRLAPEETLSDPQVFELRRGNRDRELIQRPEVKTGAKS